jgi:hypothetical protein
MLSRFALVLHWLFFSVGAAIVASIIIYYSFEINDARPYPDTPPSLFSDEELLADHSLIPVKPELLQGQDEGEILSLMRELEMLIAIREIRENGRSWDVDWQKTDWWFSALMLVLGLFSMLCGFTIRFILTGSKALFPWTKNTKEPAS